MAGLSNFFNIYIFKYHYMILLKRNHLLTMDFIITDRGEGAHGNWSEEELNGSH